MGALASAASGGFVSFAGAAGWAPLPLVAASSNCWLSSAGTTSRAVVAAARREREARGFSVLGGGSCSTPVTWRICETRSAFLVRAAGVVPRAKAMAKSSSRSLASSTERSS